MSTFQMRGICLVAGGERAGRRLLPSNRLIAMCHWIGSHFLDWIGYNGVVFSMHFLQWGLTFSGGRDLKREDFRYMYFTVCLGGRDL